MVDTNNEEKSTSQNSSRSQDAEQKNSDRAKFENMLTVPAYIQDRVFSWESEFYMCDRISRIGMAFDVITNVYISVLAHFTRTADVRYRLLEAPSKSMAVPVYYCDRILDSTLGAISAQRRNINKLTEKVKIELKRCVELRKSTERSYLEVKRDLVGNNDVITKWKGRIAVLLELETRLKNTIVGGPNMFVSLKKPWSAVVGLHSDKPISDVRHGPSHVGAVTLGRLSDAEQLKPNRPDDSGEQCTPLQQENFSAVGPAAKDNTVEADDSNVPETPEVEMRVAFPTQVSSPRNRKRLKALSPEEDPDGRTLTVPIVRNLSGVRAVQYMRDSPVLASLQAYGDLAHRTDVASALPPAVQPHDQSLECQNRNNAPSNSDKVMPTTPRELQQLQSQHLARSISKDVRAGNVQPDDNPVPNNNSEA